MPNAQLPRKLLLQLVHVSDVHMAPDRMGGTIDPGWRFLHLPPFRRKFKQGTMGHDHDAITEFEDSLIAEMAAIESKWPDEHARSKTWLVATGDLSTWGDGPSIKGARTRLERIAARSSVQFACLYGNHDVWIGVPGRLPFMSNTQALAANRTNMRTSFFPDPWPLLSGRSSLPPVVSSTHALIYSSSLNTVMHEQWPNAFAYGHVREDFYWNSLRKPKEPDQTQTIVNATPAGSIRLVFTHHPLHDPACRQAGSPTALQNAATVASWLRPSSGLNGVKTVVISGHTHETFPEPGQLPASIGVGYSHLPLAGDQVQITAGTLSQVPWRNSRQEHTWQLLRFWEEGDSHRLILDRTVFSRSNAMGTFEPPVDNAGYPLSEEMTL